MWMGIADTDFNINTPIYINIKPTASLKAALLCYLNTLSLNLNRQKKENQSSAS